MALSKMARSQLRSLSHTLKPVVMIGAKGVSAQVLAEFEAALDHHELVKVQIGLGDREQRIAAVRELLAHSGAQLVMEIGKVACFYRHNSAAPKLELR